MILLGPVAGVVLGLLPVRRATAVAATAAAAILGGALLGAASWHDERSLPLEFWISAVVFLLVAIGLCLAARAVRERGNR